eukprot:TRINITY_DN61902_c0_g1_i1.p1 TRINITY_DN61902_c0_g1~~TRINITY_DN61902_c0_g1_i1.p1  ORF type:complete len:396 (+),score=70.33 TRINITY_DN61902_c0_g1_i1:110-1297(+)
MEIQIGLSPQLVYACGALVWALFASQLAFGRGHVAELGLDVCKDAASLFLRQSLGSMLLMEVSCSWADFVTDLAVALSAKFPNVPLFVLMWTFIGVQVVPYMGFVLVANPPGGWLINPPACLFECRHAFGLAILEAAVDHSSELARMSCLYFQNTFIACWEPNERTGCLSVAGKAAALLWGLLAGLCGCSVLALLGLTVWVVILIAALLCSVLWVLSWVCLIFAIAVLRLLLFGVGFLLYATKLISFTRIPLVQIFFSLWTGEHAERPELTAEVPGASQDAAVSLFKMEREGVNIFSFHFAYLTELLFESIAQLVIQILVAAYGGWNVQTIVSVVFTSLLILLYGARYTYWLMIRPFIKGAQFRDNLEAMHKHYYSFAQSSEEEETDEAAQLLTG